MKNFKNSFVGTAALTLAVLPALAFAGDSGEPQKKTKENETGAMSGKTIVTLAEEAGFTTLVTAVKAAGLAETLGGTGPFTVFAPTDEAFAKLPEGTVESLLADPETLKKVLLYHVVSGSVMAADVVKLDSAQTLNGTKVTISTKEGVKVDAANVVKTDILARNGVVHVIDTVLIPQDK